MKYTVSGRTLSNSEIILGAKGDNAVEKIDFMIPRYTSSGVDLSLGIGYAVFRLPDGETDGQVMLTPEVVDDDTVCMTLLVGEEMTTQKGRGKLCLKIAGLESAMWSSEVATTYVVSTIDMPSPQPFSMFRAMSVGSAARLADPESEQPFTVTERTINIPAELQTIAVASDENSESVSIVVPRYFDGIDLSEYNFILHTEMAGNGVDDILFNNQNGQMKSIEDSTVTLTWVLRPPQTSYEGKLSIQLFVQGESFAWHSLIGELTVAKHLVGDPVVPTTPSLYEQWLAQITAEANTVKQYGGVLTTISDNIDEVLAAPDAADRAEKAAEEAKKAAQEALGFRTFFSAVTPDENGDLDPSRPMTTPSAASVTAKSKGDRIQIVQVNGFTTQAGTGDPSPTNVRAISTAGMKLVKKVLTGAETWSQNTSASNTGYLYTSIRTAPGGNTHFAISTIAKNQYSYAGNCVFVDGSTLIFGAALGKNYTVDTWKAMLAARYAAGNPVIVWYTPADESQATGLYIPIQAQGHEYRCQMMELNAPLCAGDKVDSCVPSGCDKTITVDGSTVTVTASGSNYIVTAADAADAAASGNVYAEGLAYLSLTAGQVVIPASSFPASVTSAQTANAWLQSNPQKVWYQSTAYTEADDIPVQLETHAKAVRVLDGDAGWVWNINPSGSVYRGYIRTPNLKNAGEIICSVAKKGDTRVSVNAIQVDGGNLLLSLEGYSTQSDFEAFKSYLSGNPATAVAELATPAVYAHNPVTLVAVPYTQADVDAANQLANTPSTLPAIDSPDVPMLLDETGGAEPAAQVMALAANAVPVAGTYVVSSQNGTTVAVSLKAMQDGGDAATLGGMTVDDIKQLISDMIAAAASGS